MGDKIMAKDKLQPQSIDALSSQSLKSSSGNYFWVSRFGFADPRSYHAVFRRIIGMESKTSIWNLYLYPDPFSFIPEDHIFVSKLCICPTANGDANADGFEITLGVIL